MRTEKILKRVVTLLLCLLMITSLLPTAAYAATTPAKVTQEQARVRIEKLKSELSGKYFTVNGKACKKPGEGSHGCNNCKNADVIKAGWFKTAVSLIPSNITNCPEGHYCEYQTGKYGGTTASAKSCAGFATFASWYIFGQKSSDKVKNTHIKTGSYNANLLKEALPGDLVIFGNKNERSGWSHAAIFIEATSTGAKVLDCNWNTKDKGNCYVSVHVIKFSKYNYMSISRATNYDTKTTAHTHTAGTVWQNNIEKHWKLCTANDGYRMNEAEHDMDWVFDCEAGLYQRGQKHGTCTVCGYESGNISIPMTVLRGDLNNDGTLDIIDLAAMYDHLTMGVPLPTRADLKEHGFALFMEIAVKDVDGSGSVDVFDLQCLYEMISGLRDWVYRESI